MVLLKEASMTEITLIECVNFLGMSECGVKGMLYHLVLFCGDWRGKVIFVKSKWTSNLCLRVYNVMHIV